MKQIKFYSLLIILLLIFSDTYSQYNETIRTGRPGQAIGAFTVGKKILQFQQGFDYNSTTIKSTEINSYLSNNVVRYGISELLEVSFLADYQNDEIKTITSDYNLQGISNFHIGFRTHIADQNKWIPSSCFQARLKLPNISNDYGNSYIAPIMIFVANWSLPKQLGLNTNWILTWDVNSAVPVEKYVVNFNFPLGKQWGGFIENYGTLIHKSLETRFDYGISYLASNDIQFDLYAGNGKNNNTTDYFVSVGISWRLNFNSKENAKN